MYFCHLLRNKNYYRVHPLLLTIKSDFSRPTDRQPRRRSRSLPFPVENHAHVECLTRNRRPVASYFLYLCRDLFYSLLFYLCLLNDLRSQLLSPLNVLFSLFLLISKPSVNYRRFRHHIAFANFRSAVSSVHFYSSILFFVISKN